MNKNHGTSGGPKSVRLVLIGVLAALFPSVSCLFAQAGGEEEVSVVLDEVEAVSSFEEALVLPSNFQTPAIFGFNSTIVETPRNISLITAEQMEVFDINKVEDFKQFSSGISVVTSFGDQQTPFIRGDLSDAYPTPT